MSRSKSLLEIVLMPLVLALVGTVATWLITRQSQEAAEAQAAIERQRAAASAAESRQVKLLEIFADKIASANENERALAMYSTLALDLDLAAKLLPTFLIQEERSPRLEEIVCTVTAVIILRRVAQDDAITAVGGRWYLMRHDQLHRPTRDEANWIEIAADTSGSIEVRGAGWQGDGVFNGERGHYDWRFDGPPERIGRTHIYLDESGILYGRVSGSGLDWAYWAYPVTDPANARDCREPVLGDPRGIRP